MCHRRLLEPSLAFLQSGLPYNLTRNITNLNFMTRELFSEDFFFAQFQGHRVAKWATVHLLLKVLQSFGMKS